MKKIVLKLDFHDEKSRHKVMKTASGISGVESVALDKDQKLTLTGDIDSVVAVRKLRRLCHTDIVSVGPAKEPEKKKEEPKKDEKKDEKGDANKSQPPCPCLVYYPPMTEKGDANKSQPPCPYNLVYYPPMTNYHAPVYMDEDPAGCVIC